MIPSTVTQLNIVRADQRPTEFRTGFTSHQSFNFGHNYQKGREGFKALRVFNDDYVAHNTSIPLHPHQNFEILSVILEGQMSHEDNLGNNLLVETNEVKLMSAGTGLYHGGTCYHGTNFLQIWIVPNELDTDPVISKMAFDPQARNGTWQLQVSPNESDHVLTIKQNLYVYRGRFKKGERVTFTKHMDAYYFLMPLMGAFNMDNQVVHTRDSAEFFQWEGFEIEIREDVDLWLMVQPNS
jgi:redox-sensitive bicupin YhaK (pirin superfamily)